MKRSEWSAEMLLIEVWSLIMKLKANAKLDSSLSRIRPYEEVWGSFSFCLI